jgi:hypothetical protein
MAKDTPDGRAGCRERLPPVGSAESRLIENEAQEGDKPARVYRCGRLELQW